MLQGSGVTAYEPLCHNCWSLSLEPVVHKRSHCSEELVQHKRVAFTLHGWRQPTCSNKDSVQPKINKYSSVSMSKNQEEMIDFKIFNCIPIKTATNKQKLKLRNNTTQQHKYYEIFRDVPDKGCKRLVHQKLQNITEENYRRLI